MKHSAFPRDLGAARYLDLFVVGGVSAVLAIRFILRITGYPSLGGARFHIAHMLWGGLLMAAVLLTGLSFPAHAAHSKLGVLDTGLDPKKKGLVFYRFPSFENIAKI
jgi:hypothetical protein